MNHEQQLTEDLHKLVFFIFLVHKRKAQTDKANFQKDFDKDGEECNGVEKYGTTSGMEMHFGINFLIECTLFTI